MYIICIESSKTRGMGHFFRSLLYASYLQRENKPFILLINDDTQAIYILKAKRIPFRVVDFADKSDWETAIIEEFKATVWLQDKFETPKWMAEHIVKNNILFCAIDEFGPGAELCDIHFAGMIYLTGHEIKGRKIYRGPEYVILNPEIEEYKKVRTKVSNIIISLGGSDPFGMTVDVVRQISKTSLSVEVVVGPDFDYFDELNEANIKNYPVVQNVPSLIKEFSKFDFAITGGGITCCEANSCGLPCVIIANAPHEMKTGLYMEHKGGAVCAGSYEGWNRYIIDNITNMNIEQMSIAGMTNFDTKAIERIFSIIEKEKKHEG